MDITNDQKAKVLEIKTAKGIKYISQNRIIYVKAENRGTVLLLNNSDRILTKHLIKWFEKYLISPEFFRCHNSYIINCRYFDCLSSCQIILKGQIRIPLSRNRKRLFKENLILLEQKLF
ncbi:MAG: LytTR family transcriptional regulator [Bacteroidales bacterium]|jgi:two-component system LytT family response regulator|nr:LytTR family transcriptional regulator [Bacteroidales bacterium]